MPSTETGSSYNSCSSSNGVNYVETKTQTNKDDSDHIRFQTFLIDQLTKIQEQNENLLSRVTRLEKEQEEYYLCNQSKMEMGFKNVAKCTEDLSTMKEIFKEVVGIMTGERVKFVDHSEENITNEEALRLSSSTLLASNSKQDAGVRVQQSMSDFAALRGLPVFKMEESDDYSRFLNAENINTSNIHQVDSRDQQLQSNINNDGNLYDNENDENINNDNSEQSRDIWVPSGTNNTPSSGSSNQHSDNGNTSNYRMNRALQSVHDVAREYFEGLPGRPSLMFLERRYGSTWRRSAKERTLFAKRMCIIHKINDIKDNPKKYGLPDKLQRNQAIKVVENIRLGNNSFKGHNCRLSISQLYTYFSKKMDTLQDYSLELKIRGEPRRHHLMRERMARLEQDSNLGSESVTPTEEHIEQ